MRIEYLEPDSIRSTNKKRTSLTFDPPSFLSERQIFLMIRRLTSEVIEEDIL